MSKIRTFSVAGLDLATDERGVPHLAAYARGADVSSPDGHGIRSEGVAVRIGAPLTRERVYGAVGRSWGRHVELGSSDRLALEAERAWERAHAEARRLAGELRAEREAAAAREAEEEASRARVAAQLAAIPDAPSGRWEVVSWMIQEEAGAEVDAGRLREAQVEWDLAERRADGEWYVPVSEWRSCG